MSILQKKIPVTAEVIEKSGWTIETLHEHMIAIIEANESKYVERFNASQNAVNAAFTAQQTAMQTALTSQKLAVDTALGAADRAVAKAETATDKRFESVNEFRATLSDLQSTFIPRLEAMALFRSIEEKMEARRVTQEKHNDETVKSFSEVRLAMLHLLSIESYETRHSELQRQVNDLRESRSEISGKSSGANALWGYIVAVAGIGLALVSHFFKG